MTGLDLKPLFYRDMTVYFGPRAVSFVFQLPTGGLDVITILRETGDAIISQNTVYADGVFPHMQAKTKCKEI